MKLKITGIHLIITDAMQKKVEEKLNYLNLYLDEDVVVKVTITKEKDNTKIIVRYPLSGHLFGHLFGHSYFKMVETNKDFYTGLDLLSKRLKENLLQTKNKYRDRKKKRRGPSCSEYTECQEDIYYDESLEVEEAIDKPILDEFKYANS